MIELQIFINIQKAISRSLSLIHNKNLKPESLHRAFFKMSMFDWFCENSNCSENFHSHSPIIKMTIIVAISQNSQGRECFIEISLRSHGSNEDGKIVFDLKIFINIRKSTVCSLSSLHNKDLKPESLHTSFLKMLMIGMTPGKQELKLIGKFH